MEINSIDNNYPEAKINLFIDDIYEFDNNQKILLIIYFTEQFSINNMKDLIYKIENQNEKNETKISCIFTFSPNDNELKKGQTELPNHIKLTNFKIDEKEQGKNKIKELFKYYIEKNDITDKDLLNKVNKMFDNIENIKKEKEIQNLNEIKEIDNSIKDEKEEEKNKIEKLEQEEIFKEVKIFNIILLVAYINFVKKDNIKIGTIFNKLIWEDDKETKKKAILSIIDSESEDKKNIENIFLYLSKLSSGIGKSFLKIILKENDEEIIDFIKKKLNGLIFVENNGKEEIFRLNGTLKPLVEEPFSKQKMEIDIVKNIISNYFLSFRNILVKYEKEKGNNLSFGACINNNFWFNKEVKAQLKNNKREFVFNSEIDSNNIFNIIKNIGKDFYYKNRLYIDDISISLPTLLYLNGDYYLAFQILDLFENFFKQIEKGENIPIIIQELILRLGIFKYMIAKNPNIFEKSLKSGNISYETISNLSKEAKFEYYLTKIFDCRIKKYTNIQEYYLECESLLKEEEDNDIKIVNETRLNDYQDYQDSRKIFYFLLQNPLNTEHKTQLSSNFYLTQKLKTIIPTNFEIKFKIFEEQIDLTDFFQKINVINYLTQEKNNSDYLINISFLYLSNKKLKEEFFEFCDKQRGKICIKILILGYLEDNPDFSKDNLTNKGIKNLIYISNNKKVQFDKEIGYDNKSIYYYFEHYFIEFIHDFTNLITSKYNYCSIPKAFNKAKINFIEKVRRLIELNEPPDKKNEDSLAWEDLENLIKIESSIEDDNFEMDYIDEEDNFNDNNKKISKDILDQYDYEYNKVKNIYYRKNPFSEGSDTHFKKINYQKYMKLPGIEQLNPKNFLTFVEKGIYNVKKNDIKKLEDIIDKNNIVNIFGTYENNNIFEFGDEFCKYFYMMGKFEKGIYIVSPRAIEEKNIYYITNKSQENNRTLILLKLVDLNDKEFIVRKMNEIANNLNKKRSVHFIICSEEKLENLKECYDLRNHSESRLAR